jgi:cytochrome c-type biogenesis protein CcmF
MEEIKYIGEHLWVGQLGHLFIVTSFIASLLAIISYYFAEKRKDTEEAIGWKKMGRYAFLAHGISVFSIIGLIFYIMIERMYEYAYAFNHVSDDLHISYILSAFWEGQEGSFLLWMFWHVVLGMILLVRSKSWENGVMLFLSFIQFVLSSFLLGIYIGDTKIGINPFELLRDTMNIPLFNRADYLTEITGTGLNPLLQNYWMTIHPPTLFLGFASVAVPFCFAAAGLWTGRYKEWLKPVLPWALFSGAILGTGILMGGAWAYEALSFGGYWAWDPVENMSLVPWIILMGGMHMNVVAKATGHSIKATMMFYLSSFIFVFYSTFLTRSGVLGDSSVHAFTELGLEWHLVISLLLFVAVAAFLYIKNDKKIPVPEKEESLSSKEFWMFIGSLVFLISALLISLTTSIPVFNKIMDFVGWIAGMDFTDFHRAIPADPIAHYNKYQIWVALFIGVLSGSTQFLRYKEKNFANWKPKFAKHIGIISLIALGITIASAQIIDMNAWQYYILAFGCWFAVVANIDYFITTLRSNLKLVGSVFSHIGFGLMLIGSLISGLNKHHISTNKFAQKGMIEGFVEEDYNKNILLIKNKPMFMKGYEVTYSDDTISGVNRTFTVNYKKKDEEGKTVEEFDLYPNIIYEKTFKKVAASNPSTKHYINKDIFTHVASLPRAETDPEYAKSLEDSLGYLPHQLIEGDTFQTAKIEGKLLGTAINPKHPDYQAMPGDFALGVNMLITDKETGREFNIRPMAVIRGARIIRFPEYISELNVKVKLTPDIFDEVFVREDELEYKPYTIQQKSSFNHLGTKITFNGFGNDPTSPDYMAQEGDKAFNAILDFKKNGKDYSGKPIYFIRGGMPYNIKDEIMELGLHFKIADVDPKAQNITILVAQAEPREERITVQVAEEVPSSEYIVLEAIVFPGINLFWFGSVMMMFGLLLAMFRRWFK